MNVTRGCGRPRRGDGDSAGWEKPSSTWLHQHRDKQRERLDSFALKTVNGEDGDDNCRHDKLTVLRNASAPHTKPQLLCRRNSCCL